ncbi:hypothetical protein RF11_03454 [Thelohanellus kitauei]|uniref:Uncharacterized protein n=1 Tax=Thelohanellus kitauei TaxID=669202 RepID=A0A0C2IV05_THEKT|nr:hypothetical protein RF11_03454 [Thelohanellus kitauei]
MNIITTLKGRIHINVNLLKITTTEPLNVLIEKSDNSPLDKYYQLVERAQNLQLNVKDEVRHILTLESIEAYLEVAEFAEANELEYRKIVLGYEEASQMLYDIDENRAIEYNLIDCLRKLEL